MVTITRSHKKSLLASIRGTPALMTNVYSFLTLSERVRLGEVDKQFLADEHRGRVVGVYGERNKDIQQAIESVREYLEFEGTPQSIDVDGAPDCWYWIYQPDKVGLDSDCIARKFGADCFTEEDGWDLEAIAEKVDAASSEPWFESKREQLLEGFGYVNWLRQKNQFDLQDVSEEVQEGLPSSPYNALFDLMAKYEMPYSRFLNAEDPPIYGFSDDAYEIADGTGSSTFLQHLRPGRKLIYRDAGGTLVEKVLRKCLNCNKIKCDVWDEYCGRKHCGTAKSVCRDCTTNHKCSTCNGEDCVCQLSKCRFEGCGNYMHQGCSFVALAAATEDDDPDDYGARLWDGYSRGTYCGEHKPTGAVEMDEDEDDEF